VALQRHGATLEAAMIRHKLNAVSDNSGSDQDDALGFDQGSGSGATAGNSFAPRGSSGSPSTETVTYQGSGLVFNNTFGSGVSAAFQSDVIAAENYFQSHFTNACTVNCYFDLQSINPNYSGENFFSPVTVSYASLRSALQAHATTTADDAAVAALANLPDPSGGAGFEVPIGEARILGLAGAGSGTDDSIILNSDYWTASALQSDPSDATAVIEHELSEGIMGRIGSLGYASTQWAPMDLFRFTASGQRDFTGGKDGQLTYFSVNGSNVYTGLQFHNSVNGSGTFDGYDLADWDQVGADASAHDPFGPGGPGAGDPGTLSATDLEILDVLGWTPAATDDSVSETAPSSITATAGQTFAFTGADAVQVNDDALSGETFTTVVFDNDGTLFATGSGVSGSGTKNLTVSGTLGQVNAALATLSYQNAAAGSDAITITTSDSDGSSITKNIGATITAPTTKLDYFIASESKTGDYYEGVVIDSTGKYTAGSGFTVSTTDQAGGKWTYYVYSTATTSLSSAYNGWVYDWNYYDADVGQTYNAYYPNSGFSSLGTDVDFIYVNGAFEKFGGGTYVVPETPITKLDYFFASESKTGDYYQGVVIDSTGKYSAGSGFTASTTDQAGGKWSYYVYSTAATSLSAAYNGWVYDGTYYDADVGQTYSAYYLNSGFSSLGTDVDFIYVNGAFQKFGGEYYVAGGASGKAAAGSSQSYTPYAASPTSLNVAATSSDSSALYAVQATHNQLSLAAAA
jgi:hypothetical protein